MEDATLDEYRKSYNRAKAAQNRERRELKELAGYAKARAQGKTTRLGGQSEVQQAIVSWVAYIREKLSNYVIRRTVESLDHDGKPISAIPPFKKVPVLLTPSEEEMETQLSLIANLGKLEELSGREVTRNLEVRCFFSRVVMSFRFVHRKRAARPHADVRTQN